MAFEGIAGARGRSDGQYYIDIVDISEHLVPTGEITEAARRMNTGVAGHADYADTDLLAFFERIDGGNNDNNSSSSVNPVVEPGRGIECRESERLSGIMKSLEEEINAKQHVVSSSKDEDPHALVDNSQRGSDQKSYNCQADNSAPHYDILELLGINDRPYNYGDNLCNNINEDDGGELGFNFMDSVGEMNVGLNYQYPFVDEDSIGIYGSAVEVDNYWNYIPSNVTSAEDYGDGGEFFDESLWEDCCS